MTKMKDRCIHPLLTSYLAGGPMMDKDLARHCKNCQQLVEYALSGFAGLPADMTMGELLIAYPCTGITDTQTEREIIK